MRKKHNYGNAYNPPPEEFLSNICERTDDLEQDMNKHNLMRFVLDNGAPDEKAMDIDPTIGVHEVLLVGAYTAMEAFHRTMHKVLDGKIKPGGTPNINIMGLNNLPPEVREKAKEFAQDLIKHIPPPGQVPPLQAEITQEGVEELPKKPMKDVPSAFDKLFDNKNSDDKQGHR